MITIPSKVESHTFSLYDLEQMLKPIGYVIGGNWDYEHGSFDYKMEDDEGYQFLRVPFIAVNGQLDDKEVRVKLGQPYLLAHQYQSGLDDQVHSGNIQAAFNQFQEPENPDAEVPERIIEIGQQLVFQLEEVLFS
ncbi:YugN-like family protein [Pontibacillus litoralis]|uniref:YugN-like family protein n=1 Tax=Pontibacillus litoralis JSM 072002 TaxID=1385512 RepID=A0A0A5G6D1_9BACI|nr:YugN-like family protein [Pontibacillus litoralis]KGX86733.1 hypothetical protein N784_03815 [Pontibacillus litoralis JSM 072002]